MHEPKYHLNKRDRLRYSNLVCRDCLDPAGLPPGYEAQPEFPPLTKKEKVELERLQRKMRAKINCHPAVQAQRKSDRAFYCKLRRMSRQFQHALDAFVKNERCIADALREPKA